jgi:hypothetical protein
MLLINSYTRPLPGSLQRALFCRMCGQPPAGSFSIKAGLCAPCYRRQWNSRRYFAGLREAVLRRDGYQCRGCGASRGAGNRLAVHHRRPGNHAFTGLVTLCPACHAVVHKLRAHRRWLPLPLVELWREQHPAVPLQLQLAIAAGRDGEEGREKGGEGA